MSSESQNCTGITTQPKTRGSIFHCPISNTRVSKEDVTKIIKECKEESFWYRALPLSVGSMAVTQGMISKGILSRSARFGSLPKVILAGVLGFVIGKISYVGTCRRKFETIAVQPFGPGYKPGFCPKHSCQDCKEKQKQGSQGQPLSTETQ